ncbi:MAG: endonuclease/exonuclease/phosphatase family protein [Acidimicrobiales bacterium]
MTFNIRHGCRPDGVVDTAALAGYVAACRPDVLALQEVDQVAARSARADQAGEVGGAAGMAVAFGPACRQGLRGRYGNALAVRGELTDIENLPLVRRGRNERRAVLLATAVVGGRRLSVAATHLSVDRQEVAAQLAGALDALSGRPRPWVLMGDLNLAPPAVIAALAGSDLVLADPAQPTFPAGAPRARIDHVAVAGLVVEAVEVLDEPPVSDHRALVVELQFDP